MKNLVKPTESKSTIAYTPECVRPNVSLADKNWFATGGPARWYALVETEDDLVSVYKFAQTHALKTFLLGDGANILVHDNGFDGLVIKLNRASIYITSQDTQHAFITAQAGARIEDVIMFCLAHNLIGLEEFSGIPGTIGGAVYINIHYFQFLLSDFLVSARVFDVLTHEVVSVDTNWFQFGYNHSKLIEGMHILVDATFRVEKVDALRNAHAAGRAQEIIRHRHSRYPYKGTCGSFFRNFYPEEVTLEQNGKKIIWIAYYLDKIGVKGELSHGGAIVSYQHANMIVNQGAATTNDIVHVFTRMQQLVTDKFNIVPQLECQLIGFD